MKPGDFVLSKHGNGLSHTVWCICQINKDTAYVKTVSFPHNLKDHMKYMGNGPLNEYPCSEEWRIPITLFHPEFMKITIEEHIIRPDSVDEYKVFLKNLVQQTLKEFGIEEN